MYNLVNSRYSLIAECFEICTLGVQNDPQVMTNVMASSTCRYTVRCMNMHHLNYIGGAVGHLGGGFFSVQGAVFSRL